MTDYESCVGVPIILPLKRPKVLPGAHVIVESGFMHHTFLEPNHVRFESRDFFSVSKFLNFKAV